MIPSNQIMKSTPGTRAFCAPLILPAAMPMLFHFESEGSKSFTSTPPTPCSLHIFARPPRIKQNAAQNTKACLVCLFVCLYSAHIGPECPKSCSTSPAAYGMVWYMPWGLLDTLEDSRARAEERALEVFL